MRSPVFSVNVNSGINRICAVKSACCTQEANLPSATSSTCSYICAPLDNRDIKIYNMQGERVLRFPRNSRSLVGHRRLVTSVAAHSNLLFSASFDKSINFWSFDNQAPKSSLASRFLNKENANSNNNDLLNDLFSNVVPTVTASPAGGVSQSCASASDFSANSSQLQSHMLSAQATPNSPPSQLPAPAAAAQPSSSHPPLTHITNNSSGNCVNNNASSQHHSNQANKSINTLSKLTDKIKI